MGAPADKRDPPQPDGNLARGCVKAASNYIDWQVEGHAGRMPLRNTLPRFDSLKCPKGGGQLRMISMNTEPEPIRAILESMGLPSTPPVPARAGYPSRFDESQLEGCDVA